jgi:uncharacterized membrane protein
MQYPANRYFSEQSIANDPLRALGRWGPLMAGAALGVYGLTRRSKAGLALLGGAAALAYAGIKANAGTRQFVARSSVIVNTNPEKAFQFWRQFENLPLFMHHLESVTVQDDRRSRWIALGPLGTRYRWDAEITTLRDNELIAWRSLPGSEISVEGVVEFRPARGDRGTLINAVIGYVPPAGVVGNAFAKVLGKDPNWLMRQDLRRFKALIEAGEIPTIEGQSHGPRSAVAAAARIVDPDRPIRRDSRIAEVFEAKRRAS